MSKPLIKAFSFPYLIIDDEKSRKTASPVLFTPNPESHLSLAALDATSLGTKFPNAGIFFPNNNLYHPLSNLLALIHLF